ncbi:chromate transporter [Sedimentibacter acidaminivorans]|jgi:chromate transporter|uniref:Chromate transporter n=1 Tax=Sedimentibacter acidaminivorans TaxID=913099 RepID=A0ABS4G9N8_9FIRM|nr:chromate transporter [Sedimentibacter acidaminivorans]MBP1924400.1 chromate transporter [Sedimentibacter acidaminivorans]
MTYLQIFVSFFQIGLFSFGGGYAALPLIENQVIDVHKWLSLAEFADLITISQMTPGPIALNAATFVGTRVGGLLGAIVATIGCITPSCIIVLMLAYLYYKYKNLSTIQGVLNGLRPAVVSLIASAGISILALALFKTEVTTLLNVKFSDINIVSLILIVIGVFVLKKYKSNPIHVIMASGVVGFIIYALIL